LTSTKINAKVNNQELVKTAISDWFAKNSYGPSFRDISNITGMSLGTVHSVCRELREARVIDYTDNVARTIRMKGKK
jgi:SOS-response transcriptional repressor LexA